jgi:hypothetical protein
MHGMSTEYLIFIVDKTIYVVCVCVWVCVTVYVCCKPPVSDGLIRPLNVKHNIY